MRYLLAVIDHETGQATPEEMAEIDGFNDRLVEEGQLVLAVGLAAPKDAVIIDNRGGRAEITSGPLVASPEYMSGMWVIEADSDEQARELALEGSRCCNRKIEMRAMFSG